ncbi:MAG: AsmA family protein, partial [Candidatus Aminicenantes bacterium]|nr:AsmA family protein [Candidatus Aminicenantes bacterium]
MSKGILSFVVSSRKRRIALGILLFVLVVIVIGSIILHTERFKSYLLEKANSYVQKQYSISLSAGRFDYSLLKLSVALDDVQIKPITPEASPLQLFEAQRLFVNLPLSMVLFRKLYVQQLRISHPQIVVTQQAKNKADSPQLPQKGAAKKGKPTWLRIDEFDLTDGILDYNDRQYSLQGSIS